MCNFPLCPQPPGRGLFLHGFPLEYIVYQYVVLCSILGRLMGIVKISDQLHEEVRKNSVVMERSINSQAEFWMKIGRLAEQNPSLTYEQILEQEMRQQKVNKVRLVNE